MNNKLSKRLSACADFVPQGAHVADVGCDHGYLSIYLLQNGIASKVYAGDINEGPLQSAVLNAEKAGLKERISFYLSDGVKNIPKNFDTLVCAGMGADTMISILENAPWLQHKQYRLILQCQSKIHCLRQYLYEKGWHIVREKALKDGRFLYTVMEAVFKRRIIPNQGITTSPLPFCTVPRKSFLPTISKLCKNCSVSQTARRNIQTR